MWRKRQSAKRLHSLRRRRRNRIGRVGIILRIAGLRRVGIVLRRRTVAAVLAVDRGPVDRRAVDVRRRAKRPA